MADDHAMCLLALILAALAVAPNTMVIPGRFVPNTQPDGNSIVIRAPRGLVVIDTGRHPEHTNAILDYAKLSKVPIVAVINTHWHLDHTSGNALIRRSFPDTRVYASNAIVDARKGFLANYRGQLVDMIGKTTDADQKKEFEAEVARIDSGDAMVPGDVISKTATRAIAGRSLRIGLERGAATAGDVWVFDPATKVLASGDLVTLPAPFLDTACPSGWSDALDHLAAIKFKTLVPGHGAPMTRADFDVYRTAFKNLIACRKTKDECIDGWTTDAALLLKNEDPKFVRMLMDYYVGQVLQGDPSRLAKWCAE